MDRATNAKILRALTTFDGVLGLVEILICIMGAVMLLTGLAAAATLLFSPTGSVSLETVQLVSLGGFLMTVVKGGILLYALKQIEEFRQAMRAIWYQRENFFAEKSLSEDRGLWVYAAIRGLIVVFLLLFCTGT